VVWVRPNDPSAPASIIGSWNNWKSPGIPLVRAGDSGYFGARIPAGAGELGYLVVEASVPHLDKDNPLTTFRGDTEVSLLEVPACGSAHLVVTRATATDEGAVTIEAELRDGRRFGRRAPRRPGSRLRGARADHRHGRRFPPRAALVRALGHRRHRQAG
jgi:hypothetical protein